MRDSKIIGRRTRRPSPEAYGHVVEREDEPPLDPAQEFRHSGEVVDREHPLAVAGLVPEVGRVEIEQGARAVVAPDEHLPIEALDVDALKPLVRGPDQPAHAGGETPRA